MAGSRAMWDLQWLLLLCSVLVGARASSLTKAVRNSDLGLPPGYNKHLRPNHKGVTDAVDVGFLIYSVGPISETEMTMTFDSYFRLKWSDERLIPTAKDLLQADNDAAASTLHHPDMSTTTATPDPGPNATRPPDFVTLGEEYATAMWTPDIFFPDAVEIRRPGKDVISNSMVLVLYESGTVFRSMRLQMKNRCKLRLTYFPMDMQQCDICFESYKYHSLDVNISWWRERVGMDQEAVHKYGTANFEIIDDIQPTRVVTENFGYPYTKLCVQVTLKRKLSIFLITIYLPSISLVALSWVGFWIDKRAVPARASLTITTILAQITLITGAANQFPGIADLKVADLYLIVNFFYVFASLIEFALVSYEPPVQTMAKTWLQGARLRVQSKDKLANGTGNRIPSPPRAQPLPNEDKTTKKRTIPSKYSPRPAAKHEETVFINSAELGNFSIRDTQAYETLVAVSPPPPDGTTPMSSMLSNQTLHNSGISLRPARSRLAKLRTRLKEISALKFNKENADEISKLLFPLTFIVWNIVYFIMGFALARGGPT